MNKIKVFNKEQIDNVLKNKYVLKFNGKYITYNRDFKIRAVDQYLNGGQPSKQIFEQAGFDMSVIDKNKARYLLKDWAKIFEAKGVVGFGGERRGRPKKIKEELTDQEKIKRLELEILYLKKENDFLVKLRAKRAE